MMANDSRNTPKSSDQGGDPALSAAVAAALQEGRPDATQEGQGRDQGASSGQDSDEIEFDIEGAKRRVKRADAAKAYMEREQLDTQRKALQSLARGVGNLDQLLELERRIGELDEESRQELTAIFDRSRRSRQPQRRRQQPEQDEGDLLDDEPARESASEQLIRQLQERLERAEAGLQAVATDTVERRKREHQSKTEAAVDQLFASYKDLQGEDLAYARENALLEIGSRNGEANLEQIVGKHAGKLTKIGAGHRRGALPQSILQDGRINLPKPEGKTPGADMASGKYRGVVANVLAQLAGSEE